MFKNVFLLICVTVVAGAPEFKDRNILYPEKYSWCQTTPIQQVVASLGYESVTINNNVCVGACYSYSIPSTQPAEPGELLGPYCDSCQPTETKCYHVTLPADSNNIDGPKIFQKRVQIILNCACMSCGKLQQQDCEVTNQNTLELPQDLFTNQTHDSKRPTPEEVPELLHFKPHKNIIPLHQHNMNISNSTREQRFELNSKLISLLKTIQDEDEDSSTSYNSKDLKELLNVIEGSESELTDKSLMEFVNYVNVHNSEDLEVDLTKLKEVLVTFQKTQHILEKHRDFGLGLGQKNNAAIESALKKYKLPSNFGLEGVLPSKVGQNANHQHHLGEEIPIGVNVGYLVKGPHGSMVLAPTLKVEEKLNIDSDVLKPNYDGTVITYENHSKNKINEILTN